MFENAFNGNDQILVINVGVCLICQVNNATARWRQTNNTYVTGHYTLPESTSGNQQFQRCAGVDEGVLQLY